MPNESPVAIMRTGRSGLVLSDRNEIARISAADVVIAAAAGGREGMREAPRRRGGHQPPAIASTIQIKAIRRLRARAKRVIDVMPTKLGPQRCLLHRPPGRTCAHGVLLKE
jgi:hypothetical protein